MNNVPDNGASAEPKAMHACNRNNMRILNFSLYTINKLPKMKLNQLKQKTNKKADEKHISSDF